MKKTLIALVALSGLAMAGHTTSTKELVALDSTTLTSIYSAGLSNSTDTKLNGGNESITFGTTAALDNYIITFALETLPNADKDAVLRTRSGNTVSSLSVVTRGATGDNPVLTFCRGDVTTAGSQFGGTLTANANDTFALTVYTSGDSHTVYLSNLTTNQMISVSGEDLPTSLTTFDLKSGTSRVYSSSGAVSITVGEVADLSGLTAAQVASVAQYGTYTTTPEPATATLSLLALAGLASRRRRH